jgi:hypothetical protein
MYIKGRLRMNWDADDPFGSPPWGPTDRNYYPPREYDDVGADWVHPVSAGPADIDRHRVHNSEFEMRTEYAGDWPGLCTFSIDPSRTLIKRMTKNGFNTEERFSISSPWTQSSKVAIE